MQNGMQAWNFCGQVVEIVEGPDGEPWWIAEDVCAILEHSDTSKAVSRLDDDEKGKKIVRTPGGAQEKLIINEPGLFSLLNSSRKPQAKPFRRWVNHEVLPSIRKTGRYESPGAPHSTDSTLLALLTEQQKTNVRHDGEIIKLGEVTEDLKKGVLANRKRTQKQARELADLSQENQVIRDQYQAMHESIAGKAGFPTCYRWINDPKYPQRRRRWSRTRTVYAAFCRGVAAIYRAKEGKDPERQPIPGKEYGPFRYPAAFLNEIDADPQYFRVHGVKDPLLSDHDTPLLDKSDGNAA